MQSHKIIVEPLQEEDIVWYVEVAGVNMLTHELKRTELINLEQLYTLAFKGSQEGTAFIAKRNGEPVGAIGGLLIPSLFNPQYKTLVEVFWYVPPEMRNTRVGALLLMKFEEKAQEIADDVTLSLLPSSEVNLSTLERRGFDLVEFGFRKVIKEWPQ